MLKIISWFVSSSGKGSDSTLSLKFFLEDSKLWYKQ